MKLEHTQIRSFIGEPYYSRGEQYFMAGMIHLLSVSASSIKAKATGTRVYKVQITMRDGHLDGHCSCPAFQDFGPCKHMAATCLAAMAHTYGKYKASAQCTDQIAEHEEVERILRKKTKDELIAMIMALSDYYPAIIDEIMDEA